MTIRTSTALRVSMLAGPGVKSSLDGGEIRIYGGIAPAGADDSIGAATLLCKVNLNGSMGIELDDSTVGLLKIPDGANWTGTNVAGGTATFFRMVHSSDAGEATTMAPRIQGSVGVVGADLNLDTVALISGQDTPIRSFNIGIYAQLP